MLDPSPLQKEAMDGSWMGAGGRSHSFNALVWLGQAVLPLGVVL
jgi:hypothetical protein